MRPLFFVVGLAFVATVLISNVDAIHCYTEPPPSDKNVPCEDLAKLPDAKRVGIDPSKCLTIVDENGTRRNCGLFSACNPSTIENAKSQGIQINCCSEDLCNVPSDPPKVVEPSDPPKVVEPSDPPKVVEPSDPPKVVEPSDPPQVVKPSGPPQDVGPTHKGAVTSNPLVPLLFAVVANAIAALVI